MELQKKKKLASDGKDSYKEGDQAVKLLRLKKQETTIDIEMQEENLRRLCWG